ncbi:hypothetical protein DL93DRAFT_2170882 [Clavulina sp. PMI_390]|nr:hypothetical protein DL93DRAFT_2170882 [Clavulina sp. PMI_390]
MSTNDLEAAMCKPFRFQRILHGKTSNYSVRTSTVSLSSGLENAEAPDPPTNLIVVPSGSWLLPGGRFLVFFHRETWSIQCWDLYERANASQQVAGDINSTRPTGQPLYQWKISTQPDGPRANIAGPLKMQPASDDSESFEVLLCVQDDNRLMHAIVLRLTLPSGAASGCGFTHLRSCQLEQWVIYGPVELKGPLGLFRGRNREFIIWNWVQNTWGVATSTPDGTEPAGFTVGSSFSSLFVGSDMIGGLKAYHLSSELLLFKSPRFFATQTEAHREENTAHYPLLNRLEIIGAPFLIRQVTSADLSTAQEIEGLGETQSVLLSLLFPIKRGGREQLYRSGCYKISSFHTNRYLPPMSTSSEDSGSNDLSSTTSLSTDHYIRIKHAEFRLPVTTSNRGSTLHSSPFGDVIQMSLGATFPGENHDLALNLSASASKTRLLVETLCSDDFMVTDKISMDTNPAENGPGDSQVSQGVHEAPKPVDFGEASRATATYIDWWNGAIVEQVRNSHLLVQKVIWDS